MLKYMAIPLAGALAAGFNSATAPTPAPSYPAVFADTVDADVYEGWKQYNLLCSRCHGEEAQGSSFGPSLLAALKPDGAVRTQNDFVAVVTAGRPDKGMPPAQTLGLDPKYIDGLYKFLKGRSDGTIKPGRPIVRSEK